MSNVDLSEKIAENATKPASASNDSGSVSQHNLRDQIEADKYLKSQKSLLKNNRGILFGKFVPPGASS